MDGAKRHAVLATSITGYRHVRASGKISLIARSTIRILFSRLDMPQLLGRKVFVRSSNKALHLQGQFDALERLTAEYGYKKLIVDARTTGLLPSLAVLIDRARWRDSQRAMDALNVPGSLALQLFAYLRLTEAWLINKQLSQIASPALAVLTMEMEFEQYIFSQWVKRNGGLVLSHQHGLYKVLRGKEFYLNSNSQNLLCPNSSVFLAVGSFSEDVMRRSGFSGRIEVVGTYANTLEKRLASSPIPPERAVAIFDSRAHVSRNIKLLIAAESDRGEQVPIIRHPSDHFGYSKQHVRDTDYGALSKETVAYGCDSSAIFELLAWGIEVRVFKESSFVTYLISKFSEVLVETEQFWILRPAECHGTEFFSATGSQYCSNIRQLLASVEG